MLYKGGGKIRYNSKILSKLARRCNKNFELGNNISVSSYKIDLSSLIKIGNNVIINNDSEIPEWKHKQYGID